MINNPKVIEEILNELEEITLEELEEAIEIVNKEYTGTNYEYQDTYEIKNQQENYYMAKDYYDFYLPVNKTSNHQTGTRIKSRIEVAA